MRTAWQRILVALGAIGMAVAVVTVGEIVSPPRVSAEPVDTIQSFTPQRLVDSRADGETIDTLTEDFGPLPAGSVMEIEVAGRGLVPQGASAAALTVTAVFPSQSTFLTLYPCDSKRPNTSNLNSPAGDIRANSVFVKLSKAGSVCVYTVAATDLVIDVTGYIPAEGTPVMITPARLADTRTGQKTIDGKAAGGGRPTPGSVTKVKIAGRAGVPADASAAIVNLTAVLPDQGTYLTLFPCDAQLPNVSTLNAPAGDIRANSAVVKLSKDGAVCVYTVAATDFIIDVNGFVPAGANPNTITPARLADTRAGQTTVDGKFAGQGRLKANAVAEVQIAGRGGIPAKATAALINLTSVLPTQNTYLTVFPCGSSRPNTSTLNLSANEIRANNAFVQLSPRGAVCVYSVAETDFIVDATGYSTAPVASEDCIIRDRPVPTALPGSECQALVALYNSTNGPNWTGAFDWMSRSDPCGWQGITCTGGHVTKIWMLYTGITGPIPREFANLTELTSLNLALNDITEVPPEIGRLTKLTDLVLAANQLTRLPAEIGQLTNLTSLDLTNNALSELPAEIGSLTNLTYLGVILNRLTSLPTSIGGLTKLETLVLSSNKLTVIPSSVGNLTNLNTLVLIDNQLSALPVGIGKLSRLGELYLSSNRFTKVPVEVGALSNLKVLHLDDNPLVTFPPEIYPLTQLTSLSLTNARLTVLPPEIGNFTQLESLTLTDNQIEHVPTELGRLTKLTYLDMRNNRLSGDITAAFTPLRIANKLQVLNLGGNLGLTTTDPALAAWLTSLNSEWNGVG